MRAQKAPGRRILIQAVTGRRRDVSLATVMNVGHQTGEALVPVVIGLVIDQAVTGGDTGALLRWLAILGAVFAGLSYSFRFGARFQERGAERAEHALRLRLTERVLDARGGAEAGRLPGALANIATGDARRVGMVNVALPAGVAAVAGLLVGAVALLRVSVPLGLLVFLGLPPVLWLAHRLGRPLERRSEVEQERAAHASGVAADLVAGLRVLKGIGAEPAAVARYRRTSRDSLAATRRAAGAEARLAGATLTLTGVFIAVVALVGGRLAAQGSISVGELVAAVGLAQFLLTPLSILSWVNSELAQARASAGRAAEVLSAPPAVEPGGAAPPDPLRGRVRLAGVSHAALRGLVLDAAPGELLGVVARDPADAAALLACLGRDLDPAEGEVELDGVPLRSLDPARARAAVLVAGHDAELFEGTVLDNITACRPPAERERAAPGETVEPVLDASAAAPPDLVAEAVRAAGADEVARVLPDGMDTPVTERGRSLSGGQRQRVALARALAADPPVLVVHDPTTAVDAVTEARIAEGLRAVRRGRTTIVVATSPALLAVTDRVVVVEDGAVTAEGVHADLIRDHETYRSAVLS